MMTNYPRNRGRRVPVYRFSSGEPGAERDQPSPGDSTGRPGYVQKLEDEVARLTELVEEKDQQARESAVRARLAAEDLERAKERIRKDASKALEQKKRALLSEFLDIVDDLDRALEAALLADEGTAVADGVAMVRRRFLAKLEQQSITRIAAVGEPFDPERHEALSAVNVTDPDKDGVVLGEIRPGYTIGDETLRPAGVAVGKLASPS